MVQWSSFSFTYGTVEVRARFAGGVGTWPAVWMLGGRCLLSNVTSPDNVGTCEWPAPGSEEIDVAEVYGGSKTTVNQGLISTAGPGNCQPTVSDVSTNWHTYTLVWASGSLTWKIDGATTCTLTQGVPSTPMFVIINTALGGIGGGTVVDATLPQQSFIDYIRVTQ
jgi:beta-glucanase (GH16 family)